MFMIIHETTLQKSNAISEVLKEQDISKINYEAHLERLPDLSFVNTYFK